MAKNTVVVLTTVVANDAADTAAVAGVAIAPRRCVAPD
jgi:hypothetical protein